MANKRDSLFREGRTYQERTSYIGDARSSGKWFIYADGFKKAAHMLLENCQTTYDYNTVVYPIVFNYRHYLELILKAILMNLDRYMLKAPQRDSDETIKKKLTEILDAHKLEPLWSEIGRLKNKLEPHDRNSIFHPQLDLKKINRYIKEFTKVDCTSITFRYPDEDSSSCVIDGIQWLDLHHYVTEMGEISKILEGILDMIIIAIDQRNEFNADMYGDF